MTTGGSSPKGADEVREALVAAAARLLGHSAPKRISGRALAEEAGVNYGLVHHYFGGKEALLRAGFDRLTESYAAVEGLDASGRVEPFSLLRAPEFVRAVAYASLSGEADRTHVTHPTLDVAVEQTLETRTGEDETEVRVDVGIATVFHLARCLFATTMDPWIARGGEDPLLAEEVEERLALILRSLSLGLDPGTAARGEREPFRRSSVSD